jgi:GT2 family glycosyltransferase
MKVDLVIPSRGSESTILKTIESVASQDFPINHIFIVNEDFNEYIQREITKGIQDAGISFTYIIPDRPMGLAEKYNIAINKSSADIIVTVHSDVVMASRYELTKLVKPFLTSGTTVAVSHIVEHPFEIWRAYPFYQKCLFSRLLFKELSGINGMFDAFSKKALVEIGGFDSAHYRSAGEDGDAVWRLRRIGIIADSSARIIHLHKLDSSFGFADYLYKHYQYSRAKSYNRYCCIQCWYSRWSPNCW